MESISWRLTAFSAAEIALLLVALQYAVLAPAWTVASLAMPNDRQAAACWAAYAGGSALALLFIALGMHQGDGTVRAVGNILMTAAILSLQRGVWLFTGRAAWPLSQALMLLVTAVVATLAALSPAWVPVRIGVVAGLWAGVYFWVAADVWRHITGTLHRRWGPLCVMPLLLAGVMLAARSVWALVSPGSVTAEVEQTTLLSVGSSFTGLVAALLLQMTLVGLLVSRLVARLDRLSRHDALTSLLNRRAIDEVLAQEEQRARRFSGRMAVLMIDIDHFKQVNDSRGHSMGDRALQHLAAVMRSQLREIDHLSRWGGEEFLAVLPATSGPEAQVMAERLRDRVHSLPLVQDDLQLALTVSIGVAEWQGRDDSLAQLLGRANAALYQAKAAGRNQVRASDGAAPARAA